MGMTPKAVPPFLTFHSARPGSRTLILTNLWTISIPRLCNDQVGVQNISPVEICNFPCLVLRGKGFAGPRKEQLTVRDSPPLILSMSKSLPPRGGFLNLAFKASSPVRVPVDR